MAKYSYQDLMRDREQRERLLGIMRRIQEQEYFQDLKSRQTREDLSAPLRQQFAELEQTLANPDGNQQEAFGAAMQSIADSFTQLRYTSDYYEGIRINLPEIEELAEGVGLPPRGTAGYLTELWQQTLKENELIEHPEDLMGMVANQYLFNYVALHEQTKDEPFWREKALYADQYAELYAGPLHDRVSRFGEDYFGGDNAIRDLVKSEELVQVISPQNAGNGEQADRLLARYCMDAFRAKARDTRAEIQRHGIANDKEKLAQDIVAILMTERLAKQNIGSFADMEDAAARERTAALGDALNLAYSGQTPERLRELLTREDGGAALESAVQEVNRGQIIPSTVEIHATAKERIETLQARLRRGDFAGDEERCACLASIFAARETVGAKRGGEGLTRPLEVDRDHWEKVEHITAEVRAVAASDPRALETLCRQALDGHGGKMTETYRKYALKLDKLPDTLQGERLPTAKERIEALQEKLKPIIKGEARPTREDTANLVAQILAAREQVNAQRGGAGLKSSLTNCATLNARADALTRQLSLLPDQSLKSLIVLAGRGHGGEMKELFEQPETQTLIRAAEQRMAEKQRLQSGDFAATLDRQIAAINNYYSPTPKRTESFTRSKGAAEFSNPAYSKEQFDQLKPIDIKDFKIGEKPLTAEQFSSLAMCAALKPEFGGHVGYEPNGELKIEDNVINAQTMFTSDLIMRYDAVDGFRPRENAGAFFGVAIQPGRAYAEEALKEYQAGKPEKLGGLIAYGIRFNLHKTKHDSLDKAAYIAADGVISKSAELLESDPRLMEAAKQAGLTQKDLHAAKGAARLVNIVRENERADQLLALDARGNTLSKRERADCIRARLRYEIANKSIRDYNADRVNSADYKAGYDALTSNYAALMEEMDTEGKKAISDEQRQAHMEKYNPKIDAFNLKIAAYENTHMGTPDVFEMAGAFDLEKGLDKLVQLQLSGQDKLLDLRGEALLNALKPESLFAKDSPYAEPVGKREQPQPQAQLNAPVVG